MYPFSKFNNALISALELYLIILYERFFKLRVIFGVLGMVQWSKKGKLGQGKHGSLKQKEEFNFMLENVEIGARKKTMVKITTLMPFFSK